MYERELAYIEQYWDKITFYLPHDKGVHLGLPHKFIAPNRTRFRLDQFYWDSYFTVLGLVASHRVQLAKGMVDNFAYLYDRLKIIPARNRVFNVCASQPPFLTSMALEIFRIDKNLSWLKTVSRTAEQELTSYWMNSTGNNRHLVYRGLSRFCDYYGTHLIAEHESGLDFTSRFSNHCLRYLPVDLNSCLYKYERDLASMHKLFGHSVKARQYQLASQKRKQAMNKLMWNSTKGFFFDYDLKHKKQSTFYSLAGFYPLWSRFATREQALRVRRNIKKFEYPGGLASTQQEGLSQTFKQWDYPNGWANQQWIVIRGLLNYGFKQDAVRLAKKWLNLNSRVFRKTGKFWEKYNVVTMDVGKPDRYTTQSGFGWTNAIFVRLIKDLPLRN